MVRTLVHIALPVAAWPTLLIGTLAPGAASPA
jgi:hypothetical protein